MCSQWAPARPQGPGDEVRCIYGFSSHIPLSPHIPTLLFPLISPLSNCDLPPLNFNITSISVLQYWWLCWSLWAPNTTTYLEACSSVPLMKLLLMMNFRYIIKALFYWKCFIKFMHRQVEINRKCFQYLEVSHWLIQYTQLDCYQSSPKLVGLLGRYGSWKLRFNMQLKLYSIILCTARHLSRLLVEVLQYNTVVCNCSCWLVTSWIL